MHCKAGAGQALAGGELSAQGTRRSFRFFWFIPCALGQGSAQSLCPHEESSSGASGMGCAVLSQVLPAMTAHRDAICSELLLIAVANPPAEVTGGGMLLFLHQLQLHAQLLFQQQALHQP